jgi:hypothetical protein
MKTGTDSARVPNASCHSVTCKFTSRDSQNTPDSLPASVSVGEIILMVYIGLGVQKGHHSIGWPIVSAC